MRIQEGGLSLLPPDLPNETDRSRYRLQVKDDLSLIELCIKQYRVHPEHRFLSLTRIRYASGLYSLNKSDILWVDRQIHVLTAFKLYIDPGITHK
uniref:Uncharacterized protein n=1 Tax=Daucus carota subsp. sativus TaxID=79200 RepID=A0A162AG45_DAUCS